MLFITKTVENKNQRSQQHITHQGVAIRKCSEEASTDTGTRKCSKQVNTAETALDIIEAVPFHEQFIQWLEEVLPDGLEIREQLWLLVHV